MSELRDYGDDAKWVITGRLAQGGAQLLLVVALAQLGAVDAIADYSLGQALVLPLFTAIQVALRNLIATETHPGAAISGYFRIQVPASLLSVVLVWGIAVGLYPQEQLVIAGLATARACDSAAEVAFGVKQSQGRFREIALSSILRAGCLLVVCSAFAHVGYLSIGLFAYSVLSLGIFFAVDRNFDSDRPVVSSSVRVDVTARQILMAGVPLGIAVGISSMVSQAPRFFLQGTGNDIELAALMAIFQLTLPAVIAAEVIRTVFLSELSRRWQNNIQRVPGILAAEVSIILVIGFVYLCLVAAMSERLLSVLYGRDFRQYGTELVILLAGTLPRLVTGVAYDLAVAQRRTGLLLASDVVTLGIVVLGCRTLVPESGVNGAVLAMAGAAACQMLLIVFLVSRSLLAATAVRRASGFRFPDFLVLGAQRCGTTWLDAVLRTHRSILLPDKRKEIHFFDLYYDKGAPWYGSWFPFRSEVMADVRVGESTPEYIFWPEMPERIAEVLPNCRFVVILRNPADRAFSQYLLTLSQGERFDSFANFLAQWPTVIERGRYAEQLTRFINLFPRERFLILIYEEIFASPESIRTALRAIAFHLGVSPEGFNLSVADRRIGSVSIPRFARLFRLGKRVSVWLRFRNVDWPMTLFRSLRDHAVLAATVRLPPMSEAERERLMRFFDDDMEQLRQLLGYDVKKWWRKP